MKTLKPFFTYAIVLILLALPAFAQKPTDDCSWEYEGSSRASVKNRLPPRRGYRVVNGGRHITVQQWYDLVCGFAPRVPDKRDISEEDPIPVLETVKVTRKGYLLAAKFERGEDHDIHAEIRGTQEWEGPHVVVELAPLPEYCTIRKKLWDLVRKDRQKEGNTRGRVNGSSSIHLRFSSQATSSSTLTT